ncbi:hypothetical protein AAMO2058_000694600 [Amorphochlora amoebiformis]
MGEFRTAIGSLFVATVVCVAHLLRSQTLQAGIHTGKVTARARIPVVQTRIAGRSMFKSSNKRKHVRCASSSGSCDCSSGRATVETSGSPIEITADKIRGLSLTDVKGEKQNLGNLQLTYSKATHILHKP